MYRSKQATMLNGYTLTLIIICTSLPAIAQPNNDECVRIQNNQNILVISSFISVALSILLLFAATMSIHSVNSSATYESSDASNDSAKKNMYNYCAGLVLFVPVTIFINYRCHHEHSNLVKCITT